MTKKRKTLLALLSALCLTTGAAGLAACAPQQTDGRDATLVAIYESETQGGTTMTYEDWLISKFQAGTDGKDGNTPHIGDNGNWFIGEEDTGISAEGKDGTNGRGIRSVVQINGQLVVFYTDETYEIISETDDIASVLPEGLDYCAVTALDNDGKPVADAYLKLSYYDKENLVSVTAATGKTDANGKLIFFYKPVGDNSYSVRLADYGATEYDPSEPEGYEICATDFPLTSPYATVTVTFKSLKNSFTDAVAHGKVTAIPYSRAYDFSSTEANPAPIETNGTTDGRFTVALTGGVYSYLWFSAYVNPTTTEDDDAQNDLIIANALSAATGMYQFTVTGDDADFIYYVGNRAYTQVNDEGIPLYVNNYTGDGTSFTTENSITVNLNGDVARSELIFGLYSVGGGTVTLTVERIGDAVEIPEPEVIDVPAPRLTAAYPEKATGETLTLMPVTGAFRPVFNATDGFYHVNSADGPVLLVQLKNIVSRFLNDMTLADYPANNVLGESVLIFNSTDPDDFDEYGYVLKRFDYNAVLAAYAAKANGDGVYGVDENLYAILQGLAAKGTGIDYASAADGYQWLLACQYYAPAGGLTAFGDGTEESPYIVAEGDNKIEISSAMNGSAALAFTAPSAGMYEFSVSVLTDSGDTVSISSDDADYAYVQKTDVSATKGTTTYTLYVCVPEDGAVIPLTINGSGTTYSVKVTASAVVKAFFGDSSTPSSGIDEATAISVNAGVICVKIDKAVNQNGVYLSFHPSLGNTNATYTVEVVTGKDGVDQSCRAEYGSSVAYGNSTPLTISGASYPDGYTVHLDADETTYVIVRIVRTA